MLLLIIVVAVLLVPVLITLPIKLIFLSVGLIMAGKNSGEREEKPAGDAPSGPVEEESVSASTDEKP